MRPTPTQATRHVVSAPLFMAIITSNSNAQVIKGLTIRYLWGVVIVTLQGYHSHMFVFVVKYVEVGGGGHDKGCEMQHF